jgi:virginiamycin A acetyltransferase
VGSRSVVPHSYGVSSLPLRPLPDPDPMVLHPLPEQLRVVLLKPVVTSQLIAVGEYSYCGRSG